MIVHGKCDANRSHPTIIAKRSWLRSHATPAEDDLEPVPDSNKIMPIG